MLHHLGYAPSDGIAAAHSAALLFSQTVAALDPQGQKQMLHITLSGVRGQSLAVEGVIGPWREDSGL